MLFYTNCVPDLQVSLEILFPQNISHLLQSEAELWHSESQHPDVHCSLHYVTDLKKENEKVNGWSLYLRAIPD